MGKLSHFDEEGQARMVDVGSKSVTRREAIASGRVFMKPETLRRILDREIEKGDVLTVARLAGIMAAKRTGEMIPLCHPLGIESVELDFSPDLEKSEVGIESRVKSSGTVKTNCTSPRSNSSCASASWAVSRTMRK